MLHPLSLWPDLFSYPFLAYFILRLIVVWGIARIAAMRWKQPDRYLAIVEGVAGILVLIGLYTQGALFAVIILVIIDGFLDRRRVPRDAKERIISCMICIIAFSLLFLGPGSFALDYPL